MDLTNITDIIHDPDIRYIPRNEIDVGARIGFGGAAIVAKAVWRRSDGSERPVAVKQMIAGTYTSDAMFAEFLTEIKLLSVLHHDNIVKFLGVTRVNEQEEDEEEDTIFMVTELLDRGLRFAVTALPALSFSSCSVFFAYLCRDSPLAQGTSDHCLTRKA